MDRLWHGLVVTGALLALSVAGGGADLITVTPESAFGSGSSPTIVTNSVTASAPVSGGAWSWSYVSGFAFTILTPSGASTAFLAEGLSPGEDRDGIVRVTLLIGGSPVSSRTVFVSVART